MIRVLVAEDEKPLLRGIVKMIENIDSLFSVVCAACNGKEAIDYLTQHDVDLVFTDINMPVIDGIELLKFLNEKKPDIKTVVISGYNEFEYARSAMRYGVINYILKPIDKDELTALLSELKTLLSQHSYMQKREALILQLFAGNKTAETFLWGNIQLAYICVNTYQHNSAAQEMREPGFWANDTLLAQLRHTAPHDANLWLFWGQYPNEAILVLENAENYDFKAMRCVLQQYLSGEFVTISTSMPNVNCSELAQQIILLRNDICNNLVFAHSKIIGNKAPIKFVLTQEKTDRVKYLAQKRNPDEFMLMLQSLKQYFIECQPTQHDLEVAIEEILSILQKEIAYEDWRSAHQTAQELVAGCTDYETLFSDFALMCSDILANKVFDANGKDALMYTIDEYIQQHLSQPLSTKELSAHFGLVAPYLSKLFKQFKNISPSQYIQCLRIEKAKNLLQTCPQMLAKDIAETLGYTSALYFSKTFKKNVGLYPSEYKAKYLQSDKEM